MTADGFPASYRRVAIAAGIGSLVAGLLVVGGWIYNVPRLTDITYDGFTMKANSGAALALAGMSLLLLLPEIIPLWRRIPGVVFAVTTSLIGALTLSQDIVAWDFGIDQLLATEHFGELAAANPGRMGLPSSICFTFIGISLLLMNRRQGRGHILYQGLMMTVAVIGLVNITGNIYGAEQLYALTPYTGISRQAAMLLLVMAIGMFSARPDRGVMRVFSSRQPGGVILRRLLLPAIILPLLFGWIGVRGISAGWFDVPFGIALFAICLVLTLLMVMWWNSRALNATDLRRHEAEQEREKLLESERHARTEIERAARLKDEFLATLSHELRTPLNAILGWTHLLRSKADDGAAVRKAVDVIHRNARIQSELIADLLDMSRIISGKMRVEVQPVDLRAVVEAAVDAVRLAADQRGVHLQMEFEPITEPLMGDPARLQQIVWNLVSNGVKFTYHGGRVQVTVRQVEMRAQITVADTGQGIAPEFLPHVFDRFTQADASITRRHGGLGLGLAIVKQLVELHGGSVAVHSEGVGQGVTFTVELPLTSAAAAQKLAAEPAQTVSSHAARAASHAKIDLTGASILVLDDEADTRDMVTRLLSECGAKVAAASLPEEAMRSLRHGHFDLFVSDIGMPNTNGYQVMRNVRALGLKIPAIAVTAYVRQEDRAQALEAGFQSHVAKPIEPAELLASVASLLQLKPDSAEMSR